MFGAELSGLSTSGPMSPGLLSQVLEALDNYAVVLIRDQALEPNHLEAFARSLGPIWTFAYAMKHAPGVTSTTSAIHRYSNRTAEGTFVQDDHPTMITLKANEIWHTDSTYSRPGAAVSVFAGNIIPPEGGNTEFCDTRIAYETLDPALKKQIHEIDAFHSLLYSRRRVTGTTSVEDEAVLTPVKRPLVRKLPTGRYALCIGSHIGLIDHMSSAESEELLGRLTDIATTPDRVYSHRWRAGDVLLWDNRSTMHRATPYDSAKYEREMWITRIADESEM
jgi:alpha-ketoglutarate-dependent 2,4-dichlorophenoxyacetate dioxygenase